jgi:nondiscriminating aspartyl-tRNA synthetase
LSTRHHFLSELSSLRSGTKVTVHGWVEDNRRLGSLAFIILRDRTGAAQIVLSKESLADKVFQLALNVPRQSYILASGEIRPSRSKNFPVELHSTGLEVISAAKHPLPLDPTGRVDASLDVRLDARPLDLRNPRVASIFKLKASFLRAARSYLDSQGFIEVNTAKVIGAAAEGGAELFKFDYFGKKAYLAQSPQLFKEELTLSLQRVYEIGTYFRAERSHTTRHLTEFLSLDSEAALFSKEDAMGLLEGLVCQSILRLKEENREDFERLGCEPEVPAVPFERLTYTKALDELLRDGRQLRFGEDLDTESLKLLSKRHRGYYFIVDWPSEAKPFYIRPSSDDPRISESFDLMVGPLELASGGERVWQRKELEERLRLKGLNLSEFVTHLRVYDWGMPPHSGWGFGVERFVSHLSGSVNLREAVLYPRDTERLVP